MPDADKEGKKLTLPQYTTPTSSLATGLEEMAAQFKPTDKPIPPVRYTEIPSSTGTPRKLEDPLVLSGQLPSYNMTPEWMAEMIGWFGYSEEDVDQIMGRSTASAGFNLPPEIGIGIPPQWYEDELYGGETGPRGEALPEGALYWDYYGKPYFGKGTGAFLNYMRWKLGTDVEPENLEKWAPIAAASTQWRREHPDQPLPAGVLTWLGYQPEQFGDVGLLQQAGGVAGMMMEAVGDVWSQLEGARFGFATEFVNTGSKRFGGVFDWLVNITFEESALLGDRWKENLFGQYVTAPAKRADVWLENTFGIESGLPEGWDYEGIDDVQLASIIGYSSFFDIQRSKGAAEDLRDGMDPRLVRQKWENPLATMAGDLTIGNLLDPLTYMTLGTSAIVKFFTGAGELKNIARYINSTDAVTDAVRAYNRAENAADLTRELDNASEVVLAEAAQFASKTNSLADSRGIFQMTAGGKRGMYLEYTQNFLGRVAMEARNADGTLNSERLMEILQSAARPFSGDAEEAKRAIEVWSRDPAFATYWGEQGKMAGYVLHHTVFGPEGTRTLDWFVKMVEDADGDIMKLIDSLEDVNKKVVDGLFPTLTEVVDAERVALRQARKAGLFEDLDDASIIRQMTGRAPVPKWRIGLDTVHQTFQNFPFIGYKSLNNFFSTIYMGMSPGYALRNMVSNYFHAVVDGGFGGMFRSAKKADSISESYLGYIPRAGRVGFGGEVAAATGKFWDPSSANTITRKLNMFSRASGNVERSAAAKVVARAVESEMQKAFQIIGRDPEVAAALGAQLNSRVGTILVRRLMEEKGHVGKVAEWFRDVVREGEVQNWRGLFSLTDDQIEGLRSLRALDVEDDLIRLLRSAETPDEFRRGMEAIKDQLRRVANMAASHYTAFSLDDLDVNGADVDTWRRLVDDNVQGHAEAILWAARTQAHRQAVDSWSAAHRFLSNSIGARVGEFFRPLIDAGYVTKTDVDDIVGRLFKENDDTIRRATATARREQDMLRQNAWKAHDLLGEAEPSDYAKILADNGFKLDRPRALTRNSARAHIWTSWRLRGKAIWEGRRLATGSLVTQDLGNISERVGTLLGHPKLANVPEELWAATGGLDALQNELFELVNNSPLIKIAERADEAAARWGLVEPNMFIALGGAYVQHPGAKQVLDVFTSLGMPTAAEDGTPFDLRAMAGMLKRGAREVGIDEQVITDLFTPERMRRSFEWADEDIARAEQAARGWIRSRFPDTEELQLVGRGEIVSAVAEELGAEAQAVEAAARAAAQRPMLSVLNNNDVQVPVDALLGRYDWVDEAAAPGEYLRNFSDPALSPGINKGWKDAEEFLRFLRRSPLEPDRVESLLDASKGLSGNLAENPNFWRKAYEFLAPEERDDLVRYLHAHMRETGFTNPDYTHATMLRGLIIRGDDGIRFTTDGSHGMLVNRFLRGAGDGDFEVIATVDRRFTGVASSADEIAAGDQVGDTVMGGARLHILPGVEMDEMEDIVQRVNRLGIRADQTSAIKVEAPMLGAPGAQMPLVDFVQQYRPLRDSMRPHIFSNTMARRGLRAVLDNALNEGVEFARRAGEEIEETLTEAVRSSPYGQWKKRDEFIEHHLRQVDGWDGQRKQAFYRSLYNRMAANPDYAFTRQEILDLYRAARDMPQDEAVDWLADLTRTLEQAGVDKRTINQYVKRLQFDVDDPLARIHTTDLIRQTADDGHLTRMSVEAVEDVTQTARAQDRAELFQKVAARRAAELRAAGAAEAPEELRLLEANLDELSMEEKIARQNLIEAALTDTEKALVGAVTAAEEAKGPSVLEAGRRAQITRPEMYDWLRGELGFDPRIDPLKPPMGPGVTPSFAQAVNQNLDGLMKLVDDITDNIVGNWGKTTRLDDLPAGDLEGINRWEELVTGRVAHARGTAEAVATAQRKRTLLDYEKKFGFDLILNYLFPYQFWYGRTYYEWMKRLWNNPRILRSYAIYRRHMEKIHAGQPDWWKYQVNTNELLGVDWDNPLYFNVEQNLNPLYGMVGPDFDLPDRQTNELSALVDGLGKYGPSVWTPFQWMAALNHKFRGEDDQAAAMAGRVFPQTNLIHHILGDKEQLPSWMREPDPGVWFFSDGMDYFERRRVGRELYGLADNDEYSLAQVIDAGRVQEGDIWEQARNNAIQNRRLGAISGFLGGPGFKGRSEHDILLDEFFAYRSALISQADSMTPEEYADGWDNLREAFPFMDAVLIARQPSAARDRSLTYNVLSRIPPGQFSEFVEWADIPSELIDQFYDSKGTVIAGTENPWREGDYSRFMAGIVDLAAVLEVPQGTRAEQWAEVRGENRTMRRIMAERFGSDIHDRIDAYFAIRNKNEDDPDVAYDWLDKNPGVEQAMDWKSAYVINHPILSQYYGGVDYIERYMRSLMYADAEKLFGEDIFELQSAFWDIKDLGGNSQGFLKDTSEQYGDHSRLIAYWEWKDGQTLLIDERLADFGEKLNPLADAVLRHDIKDETFGMLAVLSGLFEAQAEKTPPDEIELDAFVRQYVTGKESGEEIEVPRITSEFYEQVPYEYVSRFFPRSLQLKLERYFDSGEPLSTDTRNEVRDIWELLGQPSGSFHTWLSKTLAEQYTGPPEQVVPEPLNLPPYTDPRKLFENFLGQ